MKRKVGGRAFPYDDIQQVNGDGSRYKWSNGQGMTLLDYYAGQVITGILSNPKNKIFQPCEISKLSFDIAEEMVKESIRSKEDL